MSGIESSLRAGGIARAALRPSARLWLCLVCIYASATIMAVYFGTYLRQMPKSHESINSTANARWADSLGDYDASFVRGEQIGPLQPRMMSYYVAYGLHRYVGLNPAHARLLIMMACVFATGLLAHVYFRKWLPHLLCLLGSLWLFVSMPLITHFRSEHLNDYPANVFFIIGLILVREKKDVWLAVLIFVAAFNRETTTTLAALYFIYRWGDMPFWKLAGRTLVLLLCGMSVYIGLRLYWGPEVGSPLHKLMTFSESALGIRLSPAGPRPYAVPLEVTHGSNAQLIKWVPLALWLGVFWVLPFFHFQRLPKFLRRALLWVPVFLVPCAYVAFIHEVGTFTPFLYVFVPAALIQLEALDDQSGHSKKAPRPQPLRQGMPT